MCERHDHFQRRTPAAFARHSSLRSNGTRPEHAWALLLSGDGTALRESETLGTESAHIWTIQGSTCRAPARCIKDQCKWSPTPPLRSTRRSRSRYSLMQRCCPVAGLYSVRRRMTDWYATRRGVRRLPSSSTRRHTGLHRERGPFRHDSESTRQRLLCCVRWPYMMRALFM